MMRRPQTTINNVMNLCCITRMKFCQDNFMKEHVFSQLSTFLLIAVIKDSDQRNSEEKGFIWDHRSKEIQSTVVAKAQQQTHETILQGQG